MNFARPGTGRAIRPFAAVIGDPTKGETFAAAPIARDGRVFIGNAGGDNVGVTGRMMAFDATTGGRLWSFDLVPTIAAAPSLITTRAGRHLIIDTGKDGHVYAVDRATGDKIYATPVTTIANADAPLTPEGTHFCPGIDGGVEWNGPSYSSNTNMLYVNSIDWCTTVTTQSPRTLEGRVGLPWTGTASRRHPFGVPDTTRQGWITAVDADNGTVRWQDRAPMPIVAGITATAGGVVFTGGLDGEFLALVGGPGWESADDWAALLASAVIFYNGVEMLRPAAHDLMDRVPDRGVLERVEDAAMGTSGVLAIEKLKIRRAGTGYYVDVHVQADPELSLHAAHILSGRVKSAIRTAVPRVLDVLVHMEPFEEEVVASRADAAPER